MVERGRFTRNSNPLHFCPLWCPPPFPFPLRCWALERTIPLVTSEVRVPSYMQRASSQSPFRIRWRPALIRASNNRSLSGTKEDEDSELQATAACPCSRVSVTSAPDFDSRVEKDRDSLHSQPAPIWYTSSPAPGLATIFPFVIGASPSPRTLWVRSITIIVTEKGTNSRIRPSLHRGGPPRAAQQRRLLLLHRASKERRRAVSHAGTYFIHLPEDAQE